MMQVLRTVGRSADHRLGIAAVVEKALKKVFPDHWSFFLGELALYSFVILIITGTYLAFFFKPSLGTVVYHGSYHQLDGLTMSEAYASTLKISFDIRGGLLVRQIHHWAALIFVGAICLHMIRIFMTGAFRRPREINWVIGVTLFLLAVAEGFLGYSLPDDDLSGTGVRIAEGVMLSVPVIGTYIQFFVFGGQYPGTQWVHRFYIAHVFIIPALLAALIGSHLLLIWHQGHSQFPGKEQRESNEVGDPLYPRFMAKTTALFFFVFGAITVLATAFQINPIWLWGPYDPSYVQNGSQPDWYIGFMEGSLRMMPNVVTNVAGHTIAWNVFIPAVVLPIGFFLVAGVYPLVEEYVTADLRFHQLLDRPRNAPNRTALGAGVIAMGLDLLLAGSDDITSWQLNIPLYKLVWFYRIGFFVFPVLAFLVARHICLALQRADRRTLRVGAAIGVARQDGAYLPVSQPVSSEDRDELEAHRPTDLIAMLPRHVVPLPTPRRVAAQVKARANRFYTLTRVETKYGVGRMDVIEAARQTAEETGEPPLSTDGQSGNGQSG